MNTVEKNKQYLIAILVTTSLRENKIGCRNCNFYTSILYFLINRVQLYGAAEYTDCTLCRRVRPSNECPGYDTKQSDGEALVILELCGNRSILSLPSLPGPLGLGVEAPYMVLSMGQIELFDISTECKQMTYPKLDCLKYNGLII